MKYKNNFRHLIGLPRIFLVERGFTPLNRTSDSKIRNLTGFTLIELLVVVVIIGVLVTFATITINSARAKGRDAKRISDIKQLTTALELYFYNESGYPANITPGQPLVGSVTGTTYMKTIPQNPPPRADGTCADSEYIYTYANNSYSINYCLGKQVSEVAAGSHDAVPGNIAVEACGGCVAGTTCVSGVCVADCATNTDKSKTCPASPSLGCKCGGGTVFDTTNHLIASPSNCTSSTVCTDDIDDSNASRKTWKTTNEDDLGSFSNSDGLINHAVIICNDSDSSGCATHPAFELCTQLNVNGQSDWYLPSRDEMVTLCNSTVPYIAAQPYFVSTENDAANAIIIQVWASCNVSSLSKSTISFIRCIRKY